MFGGNRTREGDYTAEEFGLAADLIQGARKRMNRKGDHWIQGALMRFKDFYVNDEKVREKCYCMVGGLNAEARAMKVSNRILGLAKKIVATQITGTECTRASGGYNYATGEYDGAEDVIIGKNDNWSTRWSDVTKILSAAGGRARKLSRKLAA